MRHWVYNYRYVRGDVVELDRTMRLHVREIIRTVTGGTDDTAAADGSFVAPLSSIVAGRSTRASVRITTGVAAHEAGRLIIPVQWHGDRHAHLLPDFDGAFELEPQWNMQAQLTLTGSYRTPLGPLGAAVDSSVLSGVAAGTVETFVDAIGAELERLVVRPAAPPRPPAANPLLRVRDVMSADPIVLREAASVAEAANVLLANNISGAPVVAPTGRLVGVLSERDLLDKEAPAPSGLRRSARQTERRHGARTVGQACTRPATTTTGDALLREAAALMREHGIGRLVVVDNSEIAGMVTRHDILKALVRSNGQLQAAVDAVLAGSPAAIHAVVQAGAVTLSGFCTTHNQANDLVNRVSRVDGLIAVDDALSWEFDDLLPLPVR